MTWQRSGWGLGALFAGTSVLVQFVLAAFGLGDVLILGEVAALLLVAHLYANRFAAQIPKATAWITVGFSRVLIIGLNFLLAPEVFSQQYALLGILVTALVFIPIDYVVLRWASKKMLSSEQ